jgi:CHRD domain-containing protein
VTGIQEATQGHIHSGAQGENGPVVASLFNFSSPQNAVLQNGTTTADNLEGPMQGKTIPDLIAAMKNGSTYVNVHTEQNQDGE